MDTGSTDVESVESTGGSVVTRSLEIDSEASAGVSVVLRSIDSEFMGPGGVVVGSLDVVVWAGEILLVFHLFPSLILLA